MMDEAVRRTPGLTRISADTSPGSTATSGSSGSSVAPDATMSSWDAISTKELDHEGDGSMDDVDAYWDAAMAEEA